MKILFVSSLRLLVDDNNIYHHHCYTDFLNRYKYLGDINSLVCKKTISNSSLSIVENNNIHFLPELNTIRNRLKYRDSYNLIRKHIIDCDLLITHLPSPHGDIAIRIAAKLNIPIYSVIVGCVWDSLFNHSIKGKLIAPFEYYSMRKSVNLSTYVSYVTNEFLQKRYPFNGLQLGCSDVSLPSTDNIVLTNRLNKIDELNLNGELKVGTIGSLEVLYKGQEYVIKAISVLNRQGYNFHYYCVGQGDSERLYRTAKKYNVQDQIHFLGILQHKDIFNYLSDLDIYIQPSLQEGLPRAVIEAMNVALPIIGSNVGGIPELIKEDYITKKKSIIDICNKLRLLINKENLKIEATNNYQMSLNFNNEKLAKERTCFFDFIKSSIK